MNKPANSPAKSTEQLSTIAVELTLSQHYDGQAFPLILENQSASATLDHACDWVRANQDYLEAANDSIGAVLFRGFAVHTDIDFDRFVRAFDYPNFTYQESLSNAVRVNRTERVFTANEAPPEVDIVMHHEMAQTPIYPSRLLFFCEKAAEVAGQTPLCRSDILFQRMATEFPDFIRRCEALGLRYTNEMPDQADTQSGQGRSWRSTMDADDRPKAEAKLRTLGYDWQWLDNHALRATSPVLPAVRTLDDGRKVFFNQLISAAYGWKRIDGKPAVSFGDGSALPTEALDRAVSLVDEFAFDTPWRSGDVVLINNFLVMHGRRRFEGTRRVLASLVA